MQRWTLAALSALLAAGTLPARSAPNFVGQSGNIVTPNELVVPKGEFSAAFHHLDKSIFGGGDNMSIFSANYGFTNQLELGVAHVSRDSDRLLVNGKYRLLTELNNRPSVTVGVVDMFDQLNRDPGAYVIVGKNLTRASRDVRTETEGRLLHGYVGLGTGPYEGLLGGLSYLATPQLSLMAEFAPEGPLTGRTSAVNMGARYAISDRVRIEGALFDFDNIGFGISFTSGLRLGR